MFEGKKLICPVTGSKKFSELFVIKKFPIYMGVVNKNFKYEFKDLSFKINRISGSVQIHPKIPLKKLYFKSHGSGTIGKTWKNHHLFFFKFLSKDFRNNVVEIGGGHNSISEIINSIKIKKKYKLISFDPNGKKNNRRNHTIIKDFFSKKYIKKFKSKTNLVIHSHLFEHIYDPNKFLINIYDTLQDKGMHIFSVPNLKFMIKKGYANAMNFEHPYFLEEKMIDHLLKSNGFKIIQKKKYLNHSIFYKTLKIKNKKKITNDYKNFENNKKLFKNYYFKLKKDVLSLNFKIKSLNDVYLFGAHIFSQMLIFNGLNMSKIVGALDNDRKKQNKYLYGTNLKVFNPKILKEKNKPVIILRAAQYNKEIKKQIVNLINKNSKFI
tara:strand:+ start:595 stop:1734 length:1140 start_codon:yes stop_codon:yes gene_type:complete